MAASMACRKSLLNIRNFCLKKWHVRHNHNRKNSSTGAYFVFIPEVPRDTRETNAIMRHDEFPKFTELNSNNVVSGCAKLSQEFESKFDKLMEEVASDQKERSFEEIFDYIEEYLAPLQYAEHQANILTMADMQRFPKHTLDRIVNQINRTRNDRYVNEDFYELLKKLDKKRDSLTDYQRRLLDLNLLECKMAGIEVTGKNLKLMLTALNDIFNKEKEFLNKTVYHKNLFYLPLGPEHWDFVRQLPRHVRLSMAEDKVHPDKGPWKVNLLGYVYESFLEICPRRDYRFKVWDAKHTIGTVMTTDVRLHTFEIVDDIRENRRDVANYLGYKHYAEMSLETKMAKDVETVLQMLYTYRTHFLPEAQEELNELQEFAGKKGFKEPIKQWDIPFYRRLQANEKFKVEKIDKLGYFTYEIVLNKLLNLCEMLYHIRFERVPTEEADVWHNDVVAFNVLNAEDGSYISRFYIDPFARRDSKMRTTSAELGRERSDLMGMKPLSFLMLSLNRMTMKGVPTLLSYQEVLNLFQQFGNSLQQMLTTVPYSELSGQKNIEWDCIHVCGYVMRQFAKQPWMIKAMSEHYQSGEELTDTEVDRLINCQKNLSAYDMCHELYKCAFDIDCHLDHKEKYWRDIQEEVYKLFMPIELHTEDWIWCSDTTLWLGKTHAAAYYQYIWSQMLAANIFEEFENHSDQENHLSKVGRRFRDTYLSLGGAVPAKQVFRQFLGRDPSLNSLIKQHKGLEAVKKSLPTNE
ncbi:hypothetical protein ACF0H5_000161 [Mactra antiquata]